MIIYFSGTGNSKYIAKKIAEETNDVAISITDIKEKIILQDNEQFGIVTPTYFWRLPSIVEDFFENIIINTSANFYVYYIATYGTTSGQTDYYIKKYLKKKKIKLNASYSIKTVDNWTVEFNVNDHLLVNKILDDEKSQIDDIIKQIKNKTKVFINKDKKTKFMCAGAKYFYNKARLTTHLNVNEKCVGCGLCEKNCPVNAIKINYDKPEWILKKCTLCFKCIHTCPQFAINYDDKTQNNGQYHHPEA